MMQFVKQISALLLGVTLLFSGAVFAKSVNQEAPNIALPGANGQLIKLSDFKGEKLIVFFYPKASTPASTLNL